MKKRVRRNPLTPSNQLPIRDGHAFSDNKTSKHNTKKNKSAFVSKQVFKKGLYSSPAFAYAGNQRIRNKILQKSNGLTL